jgi:integrase
MARNRRFQHGSLFKRGTRHKVWVVRWWEDQLGPDGKLQRIRRSEILGKVADIPTRRQAEQICSDRLRGVNSGDYKLQSSCTLSQFVQRNWFPEVLPTLKYSTKKHYEYVVNVHLIPTFGEMQLRLITRESVQGFLNGKLRGGLAWRTVKHIRTTFGTVLGAAEAEGLIPSNPARKTRLPRRGSVEEKAPIAPDLIREVLYALPEPSHSLAWLLVLTGLRVGELLALRWRDIDFERGSLRVRQTVYEGRFDDPKTQRSKRTVPLGAKGIAVLQRFQGDGFKPETLVFATSRGTPFSRRNLLNRQLKPTCKNFGLKGVTWHWLRHANATLLDAVGTPLGTVQELLGHSSSEITRGTYLHSVPAEARKAVERVEELLVETKIGPKWTQVAKERKLASTLIQ